jgi:hypothetical protein
MVSYKIGPVPALHVMAKQKLSVKGDTKIINFSMG